MNDKPRRIRRPVGDVGIGVDRYGERAFDPTENVIALVQANKERADDLRRSDRELANERFRHQQFVAELRAGHTKEMRQSEASRLDAIRQIDVAARTAEADRAIRAIDNLAITTKNEADKIRVQLDTTALTLAKATSEQFEGVNRRIAELERTSYKGEGKSVGAVNLWGYVAFAIGLLIAIASYLK